MASPAAAAVDSPAAAAVDQKKQVIRAHRDSLGPGDTVQVHSYSKKFLY